jgi:hypothetical protein
MLHGDVRLSKASPVKYFESFLSEYSPNVRDKWVVMDQGGELYNNPLVRNVFKKYKFTIYPTGAVNSSQNGPVEGQIVLYHKVYKLYLLVLVLILNFGLWHLITFSGSEMPSQDKANWSPLLRCQLGPKRT